MPPLMPPWTLIQNTPDPNITHGFFDGASIDNPGINGTGRWLLFPNFTKSFFKLGIGHTTNNREELLAASTLLDIA